MMPNSYEEVGEKVGEGIFNLIFALPYMIAGCALVGFLGGGALVGLIVWLCMR